MKIKSLGLKISLIVAVMIIAIIVIIVMVVSAQSTAVILHLTAKEAEIANVALVKQIDTLQSDATKTAAIIAYSNDVINGVLAKDEERLKALLNYHGDDVDAAMVIDQYGTVIVRMHSDIRGDNVMNSEIVENTLRTKERYSMLTRDDNGNLAASGSTIIRDLDGNVIGLVVCSHDLTNPKYVDEVKASTNSEVTIFDGDMRLMTTIIDAAGDRVIGTKASDAVIDIVINQKQKYGLQINLFGSEYFAFYSPIIQDGEVLGMLFAGVYIDDSLVDQRAMMNTVIMIGVICGAVCILLVLLFSIFSVSKPLKKIGAYANKIKDGDLGVTSTSIAKIDVRSSDEVGMLARSLELAYEELKGYIREIMERMKDLAAGDLTSISTYDFSGDFVLIKDSINDHIRYLNKTMAEINSSSSQVSLGSKQVADGAQMLAQGATEQAESIERLSGVIAEIAEKTKINAVTANKTADLSMAIKESAERGSNQMDEMIVAVSDINDASKNISKIIKTIDDIAFQTNILALNAAVEAARAGQHGKGFAVVAEEVRNLASKSAEAAKDTGDMIQNSMNKAELGSRIAGETAASLNEIVTGINESSIYIAEIAKSSEEQSHGISETNVGIEQVAHVVQQNSATAQESAAASEEMSGQSEILQHLIAKFKLTESNNASRNLPAAKQASEHPSITDIAGYAGDDGSGSFGKY